MALDAVWIEQNERRCPLRTKALEYLRLLLDVDLYRNEVFVDEA